MRKLALAVVLGSGLGGCTVTQYEPPPPPGLGEGCTAEVTCNGTPVALAHGVATPKDDAFHAVAASDDGVVFLGGFGSGTAETDGIPKEGHALLTRIGPEGHVEDWSGKFVPGPDGTLVQIASLAVAPNGDVAVAGYFIGTLQIGIASFASQLNSRDAFLAVFDAKGALRYVKALGNEFYQVAHAVAFDPDGNVYLGGSFAGSVNFGGEAALEASGTGDGFVVSYKPDGTFRWQLPVLGGGFQAVYALAVTDDGGVIAAGLMDGESSLGSLEGELTQGKDMFLARLDVASGEAKWAQRMGGSGDQLVDAIDISKKTGEIALVGNFRGGSMDLLGKQYTNNDMNVWDMFAAFYAPTDGALLRSAAFQGPGIQAGTGVAFDPAGDVVIGCTFSQQLQLGITVLQTEGALDADACAFKLRGGTLEVVWGHDYGDAWTQGITAVGASPKTGRPLLVGGFQSKLVGAFNGPQSAGGFDAFFLELSP
ncbi:hypothetical protein [Polyangium jinanense]|uniref:Lipoprotein n=1 Tax=Polyangium jinanense TaxID=2829994 RepID=A0A9X3WZU0_9BACT|nr:hypothetical protein [Polyangium jinanense]MDC3953257.1 hypothetical protein [Polyangium jinanense]MDC3979623.1 hypothetical protein [Polyangium jinanense]